MGGTSHQMVRLVFSPLRRRRTICPSVSARALARVSPDFAFFRHFPGFFRVWYSNHSQDHGQWQVCMCVCACVSVYCVCCAVLCVWKNTENQRKQREMRVVWCVCVVWCCEVRKYTKNTRNIGKIIKPRSPFLARFGHPRTQKWSKIGHFFQRIVFTLHLGFADDFGPRS